MTASGTSDLNTWQQAQVALKFQAGDLTLARASLRLLARSASPAEHPLALAELPEGPGDLDGAEGFVTWSMPLAGALPKLAEVNGKLRYIPRQYRRYAIDLNGSFEAYLAKFSAKSRSTLKRKVRKFADLSGGQLHWRRYETADELAEFLPLAHRLSAKTYQEQLLGSGLPSDQDFIAEAYRLAAAGRIRAFLLFIEGSAVSYLYCPERDGVLYYAFLGYDPAYASASPGTVLQFLALESLFAEGRFRAFDFTEGEGQHKAFFATGHQMCGDVYVLDARLRSRAVVLLHRATEAGFVTLATGLERLGLKRRIRRLLRGHRTSFDAAG